MEEDNLSLNKKERVTRDYILPFLPDERSKYDGLSEEEISQAKNILAQEYVEHGKIVDIGIIIGIIVIYDFLFMLQPSVYGLIIAAYGSLFSVATDFHTPSSLADESKQTEDDYIRKARSEAENSVKMNIIGVSLVIGFTTQLFADVGILGPEMLSNNILSGEYPSWWGGIGAFALYHVSFRVLEHLDI